MWQRAVEASCKLFVSEAFQTTRKQAWIST